MSDHQDSKREMNFLILGMDGVGKTALIVRYITKRFIGDYDPYSEAMYTANTIIDGKPTTLRIIDTVGVDETEKREEQILWADGFILVFSLTDPTSFETLRRIKQYVLRVRKESKVPMIILANKSDLNHARRISPFEARSLAADCHCQLYEVSASESCPSVISAFNALTREVKYVQKKKEKLKKVLQRPSVSKKLQLSKTFKNLKEFRIRTYTV